MQRSPTDDPASIADLEAQLQSITSQQRQLKRQIQSAKKGSYVPLSVVSTPESCSSGKENLDPKSKSFDQEIHTKAVKNLGFGWDTELAPVLKREIFQPMSDSQYAEALSDYDLRNSKPTLAPKDAVRIPLPRPLNVTRPYRNVPAYEDYNGRLPTDGTARKYVQLSFDTRAKNILPKDPWPSKDLSGGSLRQPDWSRRALEWAGPKPRVEAPACVDIIDVEHDIGLASTVKPKRKYEEVDLDGLSSSELDVERLRRN